MGTENPNQANLQAEDDDVMSLRGTMFSVGVVLAVIVIMWVAVYCLYMSRV